MKNFAFSKVVIHWLSQRLKRGSTERLSADKSRGGRDSGAGARQANPEGLGDVGDAGIGEAVSVGYAVHVESDAHSRSEARKFLVVLAATVLVVLSGVAVTNFLVDPTGVYGTGFLKPIVWAMRAQKVELLASQDQPVSALILGSSRAMKIEPELVDRSLRVFAFNGAVNSAMVEDFVAMYRYAAKELAQPIRSVLIAVDVESFHNTKGSDGRLAATKELASQLSGFRNLDWIVDSLTSMISYQQLMLSARSVEYALTEYPQPKSSIDKRGFLTYVKWEEEIERGTFDFEVVLKRSVSEYKRRFEGFTALSASRQSEFLTLLDDLQRNHVDAYVYLTPLHPRLVEQLERSTDYRSRTKELASWLADEAIERGIPFLNATELDAIGIDTVAFYDGAHPMEETNRRIMSAIFGKTQDHAVQ